MDAFSQTVQQSEFNQIHATSLESESYMTLCNLLRQRNLVFAVVAIFALVAAPSAANSGSIEDSVRQVSFAGSLIQPGEGKGEILRRFEVDLLSDGEQHFFHVKDDLRSGCPWPDSFGITGMTETTDRVQPHLVYSFDETVYLINLPPLIVTLPEKIEALLEWEQSGWIMTAIESGSVDNVPVWTIEARERRGRKQRLTVDAATGITVRAEAEVFMGQGDEFLLTLEKASTELLDAAVTPQISELKTQLLTLQTALKRRPDAHHSELSQRQVEDILSGIGQLSRLAKETPLEELVRQMKTDAEQQQKRLATAASRATELMNSAAPDFSLSLVSGGKLESASLKGKIVILHFWDYRDAPLSEPYGQTGYLEFLYSQKRKLNVEVIGISTNPDLQVTENTGRGRRSARKLSEFMNLTYSIGHDDGALLKSLGDPRDSKGQLPLWVVISSSGKIAHYHAGFYEVDAAQGLKELEAVLAELMLQK